MARIISCALFAGSLLAVTLVGASHAQTLPSKSMATASTQPPDTASGNTDSVQPLYPPSNEPAITLDPASLIPDLPPLPSGKATLIGGTVAALDRIQDGITIQVFGGGKIKVLFDPRTKVFRNGTLTSTADLKKGERVYADTILVNDKVFARNLRLGAEGSEGQGQGVILSYRSDNGSLVIRDMLSPKPLELRLNTATQITRGNQTASDRDLVPGALVAVQFQTGSARAIARQVSILVAPGSEFSFSGRVVTLDLHLGLLVVMSTINHKTYELYLDPASPVNENLHEGSEVTVLARYDGTHYVARGLTIESGK